MIDKIALILVIVGALNWGSVGIFGFDAVGWLFGGQLAILSRIIFRFQYTNFSLPCQYRTQKSPFFYAFV